LHLTAADVLDEGVPADGPSGTVALEPRIARAHAFDLP
jgi:hypothetical protein